MVDRSATCTDESPSCDDFEWVNAWAESAVSGELKDEPSPPTRELRISAVPAPTDPQPSDEVLTAAPVLAAPDEAPLVPAAAIALVAAEPIEPQSADDRVEAAELQAEDHVDALASDDTTARAETSDTPSSEAPTWLERKPWARIFRIVARNADRVTDRPRRAGHLEHDVHAVVVDLLRGGVDDGVRAHRPREAEAEGMEIGGEDERRTRRLGDGDGEEADRPASEHRHRPA